MSLVRDDKDFQSCDNAIQTLCDPFTPGLQSLHSKYTGCADWRMPDSGRKIMKMDPKQIMAPFGLIFIQDASHKLWEASGMPPGP